MASFFFSFAAADGRETAGDALPPSEAFAAGITEGWPPLLGGFLFLPEILLLPEIW